MRATASTNGFTPIARAASRHDELEFERFRHMRLILSILLFGMTATLAGGMVYGFNAVIHLPLALAIVANAAAFVALRVDRSAVPMRLMYVVFLAIVVIVGFQVKSLTSVAYYFPLLVMVLFGERDRRWRTALVAGITVGFCSLVYRFFPYTGIDRPVEILRMVAVIDLVITTLICGLILRKYVDFLQRTRLSAFEASHLQEVAVKQSLELLQRTRASREEVARINAESTETLRRIALRRAGLQASQEQVQQFAYAASHDLKEPIRTIKSFLQIIKRQLRKSTGADGGHLLADESVAQHFQFIESSADSMHAVLESLLEYSRLSQAGVSHAPVPLESLWLRTRMGAGDSSAALDLRALGPVETQVHARTDAKLLRRVFEEVYANAAKFSPPGKEGSIRFAVEVDERDRAVIKVTDEGVGFDPQYREQVFGLFKRVHSREDYRGSGMGLAIVKRIMGLLGGEVEIDSEVGAGTTVTLILPAASPTT